MPTIHRIGVISDTHIPKRAPRVPNAALRLFEDVELILHAGDLSSLENPGAVKAITEAS